MRNEAMEKAMAEAVERGERIGIPTDSRDVWEEGFESGYLAAQESPEAQEVDGLKRQSTADHIAEIRSAERLTAEDYGIVINNEDAS